MAPLTLPDLPSAAPGMPAAAQPTSVPEIGGKLNELNKAGELMNLPNHLAPLIDPLAPVVGLAGAVQ
ncbi:hypothetical protein DEJ50_15810 [Streptomyces venezuelae]|uniref:Uncharacterized protein n=1 Tax=Streptomyces venezuelae TaxID=54571 RepID=A0A5P2D2T6_STRVZ|nr:hypothetical protein DEJ50_15810 [Streptomyces venezuelae]